jgi:magnesium transporter
MRRALYAPPGQKAVEIASEGEITQAIREGKGCLWVDFESPTEDDRRALQSLFAFHRLALEDCFAHSHHPRLHDYGDYVYLVVHAIAEQPQPEPARPEPKPTQLADELPPPRRSVKTAEIDAFLGTNYLVTWHDADIPAVAQVRQRVLELPSLTARGADRVLAELLDEIAEGYVDVVERLNEAIDVLEGKLFRRVGASALREIFSMKKDVVHLRRVCGPQREVVNRLARGEFRVVSKEESLFFRDVYDHVYRTTEMLESLRDVLTSALEVYLTITANRTNEIMKVLTIFSIVIMSASLVAGIYGMNVDLPRIGGMADFFVILVVMAAIAAVSIAWFRRRRWI